MCSVCGKKRCCCCGVSGGVGERWARKVVVVSVKWCEVCVSVSVGGNRYWVVPSPRLSQCFELLSPAVIVHDSCLTADLLA